MIDKNCSYHAIILFNNKYKDKSSMLTVLGDDNKFHNIYCHNSNKISGKTRNIFDAFSIVVIDTKFIKNSNKEILLDSKTIMISPFNNDDIKDLTILLFIKDLLNKIDNIEHLSYQIITDLINKYSIKHDYRKFLIIFLCEIIRGIGYCIDTNQCVICKNSNLTGFNLYKGGFYCNSCCKTYGIRISNPNTINLLKNIFSGENFEKIDLTYTNDKKLLNYIIQFIYSSFNFANDSSVEFLNDILSKF